MIRLHQIKCNLDEPISVLKEKCAQKLHIPISDILSLHIYKESIDARKGKVCFSYIVDLEVRHEAKCLRKAGVEKTKDESYVMPICGQQEEAGEIIVAGFGPAGMFAALLLAQMGYRPLVLERGAAMETRVKKVATFWEKGSLDPECNVQFGEGGAGTFSDGKLTARSKDPRVRKVLEELVHFGAPKEILYEALPHIGTDRLRDVVVSLRKEILKLGGTVAFEEPLLDIRHDQGRISQVKTKRGWIPCKALILAVGHSARDIFALMDDRKIAMEPKGFAVGVRVEHPQDWVNRVQYKEAVNHPRLKPATYRLTYTTKKQRGVYTFCMCPGGQVITGCSQANALVVNGMSKYAREGANANSAILVQVQPDDIGPHLLDGIRFQQELEEKAFLAGGSHYKAPVQCMGDYIAHRASATLGQVIPSVRPGYTLCDLHPLFPDFVNEALEEALSGFDHQMPGFLMPDAVFTGVETRSSSPLRILRDREKLTALSLNNFYPCGEGAGYAGGIVSAAIDGLRCAEMIIRRFLQP